LIFLPPSLLQNFSVNYFRFWLCFSLVLILDLVTKIWVVENAHELMLYPIVVLDGIDGQKSLLEFTYITNPGAAWSMLSDYPMLLTILAGFALLAIFLFRSQLELNKKLPQVIFGIICGGIAGNLSDRLFREPAAVVDFIDVYIPIVNYDYPVFNIADSGIFVGAFGYLILGLLESKKANELKEDPPPSPSGD
jgi:signal peptidase II